MAAPIRHNDPANKQLFSHPRMVADLARLLGDDWVDDLDLDQLARLPAEHVADDLRKRLADMPWWAPFKPGGGRPAGAGVLFHIEFQSSPDPLMAERMLEYAALLRNDLARSGWKPAPMGLVVAHVPLVVYNGRERWRVPLQLATPAGWAPPMLVRLQPSFAYRLIEAKDYAGDEAADGNLARAALALDAAPAAGLAAALKRAATLLAEVGDRALQRSFEVWCDGILRPRFGDSLRTLANMMETPTMLADTLREWEERIIDEGRQAGRREGRQEGRQAGRREGLQEGRQEMLEGERTLLCGQAERRFGAATGEALAGILAGVEDHAELMRIGTLIVDCASGPELLARAQPR